jgi:hypothetical protein
MPVDAKARQLFLACKTFAQTELETHCAEQFVSKRKERVQRRAQGAIVRVE